MAAPASASEQVLDMVLAVVDDDPITASEVKRFLIAQGRHEIATDLDTHSPEVRRAVQELVTEKLLRKEAEEAGIKVSGEEIQNYIKEIKAQNQVDDAGFEALLSQQGLTLEEYKKQVEGDILRARVIAARVKSRVNVVDEDITKAANLEHPDATKLAEKAVEEPEKDRLEGLFVRFDESDSAEVGRSKSEAKALADQLAEKAKNSDSLKGVNTEFHIDFGAYKPEDLKEELQQPAKSLSEGDVSSVVETAGGYYILRRFEAAAVATEAKEESPPTPQMVDDSTKDRLRKELMETRFKERLNKFLNEELPAKYHVDIKI